MPFREYDRQGVDAHSDSEDTINEIASDLSRRGVEGIEEPLHLTYDHKNNWAYLGEGHHRLAAAIKAGVTHLPLVIHADANLSDRKARLSGAPLHMDTRLHEEAYNYHPSAVHPGNFQEFEGAR
jgi:hypothetical protein